jgi:hypothetical protein
LKLWACPFTPTFCGSTLYLTAGTQTQSIQPINDFSLFLINGGSCRYQLKFPTQAQSTDKILLRAGKLLRMTLYVVETPEYESDEF